MGTTLEVTAFHVGLCRGGEAGTSTNIQMPPQSPDLLMYARSLRTYTLAFAPGTPIQVPRECLLAMIDTFSVADDTEPAASANLQGLDHNVEALCRRLRRRPSTVRQMIARGEFDMPTQGEGAYKHRGKEWLVPETAVVAYEARQRGGGRLVKDKVSDWRKMQKPKQRGKYAA